MNPSKPAARVERVGFSLGQLAGRLVAGLGGVLLNVLMTKMVADWFAGREISFSLAVFVNSYPVGIAVALIVLPLVAEAGGLTSALTLVAALTVAGFAGLALLYRAPEGVGGGPAEPGDRLRGALFVNGGVKTGHVAA